MGEKKYIITYAEVFENLPRLVINALELSEEEAITRMNLYAKQINLIKIAGEQKDQYDS